MELSRSKWHANKALVLILAALMVMLPAATVSALTSPAEWYETSPLDEDGNKIDDWVERGPADSLVDVFVCFRFDCFAADRMAELEDLATIGYQSTTMPVVQISGVSLGTVQTIIATWEEVGYVCPNEEAEYFMNTAGEAIKAHAGLYSPNTPEDQGWDGSGVTIAIMDSGVEDLLHPDLPPAVGGIWVLDGQTGQISVTNPPDAVGHGSLVAGCALGRGDGLGQNRGTAPGASLFDARVADTAGVMTSTTILAALDWIYWNWATVSPPIGVVNMSIGYRRASSGFHPVTQAVNSLRNRNITVCVSAGNHGQCDTTASGAVAGLGHIAVASQAITVGSVDHNGTVDRTDDVISGFSRVGPGPSSWSLKPDVVAYGGQCTADCPNGGCASGTAARPITSTNMSGGYSGVIGTSFASPQVAGLCAIYKQAHAPINRHPHVYLRNRAEDLGPPGWDSAYGYGLVNPAAIEGMGLPIPPTPSNLQVWGISYWPEPVVCGQQVAIDVWVKNVGSVAVDSFTIDWQRYYFGPNHAPAQTFDIGNGPELNNQGPLPPDSIRLYRRYWTPGVSDSLPVSQHSCFWGIVDNPTEGWPNDNRNNRNFTVTNLQGSYCGTPQPGSPFAPSSPDEDVLMMPLAVSHDKGLALPVDVIVENPDPDNWLIDLISPEGDQGPLITTIVDPQACLTWVTLRAEPVDAAIAPPVEVLVIANNVDYGVLGDALVLIDPNLMNGCCLTRGDINSDGVGPDIADLVYLVNYMFNGGPEPPCIDEADINGDGLGPDIADLVYLVNYMFNGGPPPAPCP